MLIDRLAWLAMCAITGILFGCVAAAPAPILLRLFLGVVAIFVAGLTASLWEVMLERQVLRREGRW